MTTEPTVTPADDPAGAAPAAGAADLLPAERPRWRGIAVMVLKYALIATLVWYASRVLRRVEWGDVGDALGKLVWWQAVVLGLVLSGRLLLTSLPLALFVEKLGTLRAIANDLVGTLVATVTPAPADIVARAALFRSWGIDVSRGISGLVLNSVLYYVVRLSAPVAGAVMLARWVDDEPVVMTTAIISGALGLAIMVALIIGSRSSAAAGSLGALGGRVAQKIRSSWPGPEQMRERILTLHGAVSDRWLRFWPHASAALVGMVAVESFILVLAMRFVGVGADQVPTIVIVASFLSVYLLMATPFLGLGVLDAALVALILDRSDADPALLVAGAIIWRVCVQVVPLLAGTIPVAMWRPARVAAEQADAELGDAEPADGEQGDAEPADGEQGDAEQTRSRAADARPGAPDAGLPGT